MPAIKAVNSRGLRIINCRFSGFETDIELDNVEDFLSQNNRFSGENDPQFLLDKLVESIKESDITPVQKRRLFQEVIDILSHGKSTKGSEEKALIGKIGNFVGDKAVDYFVQLAAAVSAGLVLRRAQ